MPTRKPNWFAIALSLAAAYALFARFLSPNFLTYYEDDAFYYFQIARSIANHHGSTFDGIHLTNGYHPLWLLTITAVALISSGKTFFILLQAIALLSFIATFFLARAIFRLFSNNFTLTDIAAAGVSLQCLLLLRTGMETTLTIPFALLLCWYRLRPDFRWTPSTAITYGLIGALTVLSRLDAFIFVSLVFLLELLLARPLSLKDWRLRALALFAGATPLALYALSNHHWFHVWMPISGQAKQLRFHHTVTLASISNSLGPIYLPYQILIVYPTAIVVFLCLLSSLKSRIPRPVLILSTSLLLLPFLQAFSFWTLSDWPIWPWYLYSFPLAMTGALLLFFHRAPSTSPAPKPIDAFLLRGPILLLTVLYAAACTPRPQQSRWYIFGQDIATFAQTHPGTYGMGDCAGTAAWLIPHPVIQLEGLTMDAAFLDDIRHQRNLNEVLKEHGVRFYISPDATLVNGCYQTREPFQAGPDSPHMTGTFCQSPTATYPHGPNGDSTLRIFDLHPR